MNKKYNNFCRKCRNQKFWDTIFQKRVAQLLSEKKDGKIVKARISKRIEEKLGEKNISAIIQKYLALEVAKEMTIYDEVKNV
jgi:hypothetical protein